jgi:Tol biopolymer transport system component/DNA-binding winged helix-turn-helix (wHTH) protein
MTLQTSFTFRFADIEVLEPELRVVRSGEPLAIEPKAFRVLLYVLRHAGQLVPKEELLTAVWGDTAVTDNSLTRAVALLRRLLDDDPHNPRYIETVATAGYRFICPVEAGGIADVVTRRASHGPALADAAEPQAKVHRSRKLLWIGFATLGVLLAGVACAWYLRRPLPTLHVSSYRQIASGVGGRWPVGTDGSNLYLWVSAVVPVSGGQVTPLSIDLPSSTDKNREIVSVSPDGTKLLVMSDFDRFVGYSLWVVDAHGGGARFLARGAQELYAAWSPDGNTVLYSTPHGDLYTVPSKGGDPRLLLASPAPAGVQVWVGDFAWSPDGSRIRFARDARYWEISADGKNAHQILPNWRSSGPSYSMCCGKWTPDGDFFLFGAGSEEVLSQSLDSRMQIWALDERRSWLHGANPEPIQLTAGPMAVQGMFALSADGKTVYFQGAAWSYELVEYEGKSKQFMPYLGGIPAESVTFSTDGKSVVYVTVPEATMWRANRDGSGRLQLTNPPMLPRLPRWSPDGRQIVFYDFASPQTTLYIVSSEGGTPKRLLPDDKDAEQDPVWSPDGRRIAFQHTPAGQALGSAGTSIRILELATGKVTDLPPCAGTCWSPRWSPDGRYIVTLNHGNDNLALYDFRENRWSLLDFKGAKVTTHWPSWSHDGRFVYFQGWPPEDSAAAAIYRVPATGGKPEIAVDLKGFKGAGYLDWWALDPDDKPLFLEDTSSRDLYALTLERK